MTSQRLGIAALYLACITAAKNTTYPTYNQYPSGFSQASAPHAAPQAFVAANSNPNVSNSVNFQHYPYSNDLSISGNWSWTVKVSDVLVPVNSSSNGPLLPNSRVAYTSYDFIWPENGDIDQALQAESKGSSSGEITSCTFVFSGILPANVSTKFENGDDSNCTNILGAQCVKNITAALHSSSGCNDLGAFSGPAFDAACGSTLGAAVGSWGVIGYHFGNSTQSANISSDSLQKGQTYLFGISAPYTPDNLAIYNQAKDNVHILALTSSVTNPMCNRAGNGSSITSAAVGRTSGMGMIAAGAVALLTTFVQLL